MKQIILRATLLICIVLPTGRSFGQFVAQNGLSFDVVGCIYNIQLGNDVGQTQAQLLNNREIPMNGFNIMFNDVAASASSIGLGFPLATATPTVTVLGITLPTKFVVNNDALLSGGGFMSTLSSPTLIVIGAYGTSLNNHDGGSIGVLGVSNGNGLPASTVYIPAVGVAGVSLSASYHNIAVNAVAGNATLQSMAANLDVINSNSPENYGIQTEVMGGTNATAINYGINIVVNNLGTDNFGVYADATGATNNFAGYFNGDVMIVGSTGLLPSDIKLKENVASVEDAMGIINKLNPKTYSYKKKDFPSMNLPAGLQYGLIAQEVEEVLPGLTKKATQPAVKDKKGRVVTEAVEFTGLNYTQLIPILLGGIKEQQATINELEKKVAAQDAAIVAMQERMDKLAAQMNNSGRTGSDIKGVTITDVALGDGQSIILDDNVPNPFNEQTRISYFLPDNVGSAQMMFYNLEGKMIKTVKLEGKGKGALNVFASDLSSGVYTYTLVADGRIVETKRMVKQ